jgi:hypothetical protein
MTEAERQRRFDELTAKVAHPNPDGTYPHWTQAEHDEFHRLAPPHGSPAAYFAPSSAELARRSGHLNREGKT